MVYLYECLDARHAVFKGNMHVGGAPGVRMIAFARSPGGGDLRYFFRFWGGWSYYRLVEGGGVVVSFWRGGG